MTSLSVFCWSVIFFKRSLRILIFVLVTGIAYKWIMNLLILSYLISHRFHPWTDSSMTKSSNATRILSKPSKMTSPMNTATHMTRNTAASFRWCTSPCTWTAHAEMPRTSVQGCLVARAFRPKSANQMDRRLTRATHWTTNDRRNANFA